MYDTGIRVPLYYECVQSFFVMVVVVCVVVVPLLKYGLERPRHGEDGTWYAYEECYGYESVCAHQ